jgi:hypothetical protein
LPAAVMDGLEGKLVAIDKIAEARALDGRNVN